MVISTRNLENLPKPSSLLRILQALALLDAILEADWDYRYYSFNSKWSASEQMGSMRNGTGDDFFAVFDESGCFFRGFSHESEMSPWNSKPARIWPGVLDSVPLQFASSLNEPAFHMEDTTFCIWHRPADSTWMRGEIEFPANEEDPDGSEWMLSILGEGPESYRQYAREYFELEVNLDAVSRIYRHEPLSAALLSEFPSTRDYESILVDAEEIGYPILL